MTPRDQMSSEREKDEFLTIVGLKYAGLPHSLSLTRFSLKIVEAPRKIQSKSVNLAKHYIIDKLQRR